MIDMAADGYDIRVQKDLFSTVPWSVEDGYQSANALERFAMTLQLPDVLDCESECYSLCTLPMYIGNLKQ